MKKPMVKLNNGKEVTLEEFVTWSAIKQAAFTMSAKKRESKIKKAAISHRRPVITPRGKFESVDSASKALGISGATLKKYIHNTAYPEYRYEIPKPQDKKYEFHKVMPNPIGTNTILVKTPKGIFNSVTEAQKAHKFTRYKIDYILSHPEKYPDYQRLKELKNDEGLGRGGNHKSTKTPLGIFKSKRLAMLAHNVTPKEFSKLMKENPKEYFLIEKT